jgi:hypothetical protein
MTRSVSAICSMGAAALSLAIPSSALTATSLGSTFPPSEACAENTTYIQTTSPGSAYAAPSDGVITRWSYYAGSDPVVPTVSVRFKVGRATPGSDLSSWALALQIVGESASETAIAGQLNTFPTRVPVKAGDFIGMYLGGSNDRFTNCADTSSGYYNHYDDTYVAAGSGDVFLREQGRDDVAAVLESDVDMDGLGDETQEPCPANPALQSPCPNTQTTTATTTATGQRTAALKKCKKKAKKKHWSKKQRKKCKKQANQLPV